MHALGKAFSRSSPHVRQGHLLVATRLPFEIAMLSARKMQEVVRPLVGERPGLGPADKERLGPR